MKKLTLIAFGLFLMQNLVLQAQDFCIKDISTNPLAPYNNEFSQSYDNLTNSWLNSNFNIGALSGVGNAMQIPINTALNDWASQVPSAMINPFSTSGTAHNRYSYLYPRDSNNVLIPFSMRDYHWEDGWELLYLGNGFYPNGESYGDPSPTRLYDEASGPNNDKVPYIILYNRYQGILRCFVNLIVPFGGYSDIKVELELEGGSLSGVLRHLEPIDRTLDRTTNVALVESFMPNAGGNNRWISADFHLGYDPCICKKMQRMWIKLYGVESFELNLTGRGISFEKPIAEVDANGNVIPNYDTDWLAVHNAANLEGGNQIFSSLDGLIADYEDALDNYNLQNIAYQDYSSQRDLLNAFKDITVKGVSGIIPGASGFTSWFLNPKPNPGDSTGGSNFLNFLNGNAKGILGWGYDHLSTGINPKMTEPKAPDMPMASYSELRFTGDVVGESQFEAIGSFFVPGSYDETAPLDDLEPWSYPAYNVAPGMAATLSIPEPLIKFESTTDSVITQPYTPPQTDGETQVQKEVYVSSTNLEIRFETPPKIALNNSLDLNMDRTATYFMIETEFSNDLSILTPRHPKTNSNTTTSGNIYTELYAVPHEASPGDGDLIGTNRYVSEWFDLETLSQAVFSLHRIDSIQTQRRAQFFSLGPGFILDEFETPNFNHQQMKNHLEKVKLKVLHDFYFDQNGTNGTEINTMQVFSYVLYDAESNINLLGDTAEWTLPSDDLFDQYIPGLITLGDETITTAHPLVHHVDGTEIFINAQAAQITGPIQVETGYTLVIQALENISSLPDATIAINPKVHLRIKKDFYDTPVFDYTDSTDVDNFCNTSSAYQANTASKALKAQIAEQMEEAEAQSLQIPEKGNTSIAIYPNPASSALTIQSQGNGIDRLTIFDAATRPVVQKTPNGSNLLRLDINNLSPGVYIVRAECGGEVLTEKLVVAK